MTLHKNYFNIKVHIGTNLCSKQKESNRLSLKGKIDILPETEKNKRQKLLQ